jgi:hypothetical protein
MKKFIKIFAIICVCCVGLIGIVLYAMDNLFLGMCGNEIFSQVLAPDGNLKAVLFQRDCGATTGFSTQISLISPENKLENKAGNIFIIDGHPNDRQIGMTWLGPKKLLIKNSGMQPHKKEVQYQDVVIKYE